MEERIWMPKVIICPNKIKKIKAVWAVPTQPDFEIIY
jgi:hypothetical protein